MSIDPVYTVIFLPRAERRFRKLPIQAQQRLSGVIDQLALDPATDLEGQSAVWRRRAAPLA
ncbi:MAG: type II toxin-antitoxin system RelE family toxin [Egibacteraceae bacterium]